MLQINSEADKNHVSKIMRKKISEALRDVFVKANPRYKDPFKQLDLFADFDFLWYGTGKRE